MQMHVGPGSLSGALGILGTALAVLFPDQKWIGGLLIVVAVLVFVFDVRLEDWHLEVSQLEPSKILPQLLMVISALGFIAGAIWYFNLPKTPTVASVPLTDIEKSRRMIVLNIIREKYIKDHPDKATPYIMAGVDDPPAEWVNEQLRKQQENWEVPLAIRKSSDPGFFIECQFVRFPFKIGADGRVYGLNLWKLPLENRGGGMAEFSGQPGADFSQSKNPAMQVQKCSVINYGQKPMLSIAIGLYLVFQKPVKDKDNPNSIRTGDVTAERPWLINIPKIDPGVTSPFVFYIWNTTDEWVRVAFPDSAVAEYIGDPERFRFRVSTSNWSPLIFSPRPEEPETNATNTPK